MHFFYSSAFLPVLNLPTLRQHRLRHTYRISHPHPNRQNYHRSTITMRTSPPPSTTPRNTTPPSQTPIPPTPPSNTTPSLPSRWLAVSAASLIHALHATAVYVGPATLLSPMRLSLHLSVEQITRPLIAFRSIQALFLLPAGYLLDIIGPQRCLRFAMTSAALLAPLFPLVTSLSQLMLLQSLCGLTKAFGGLSAMILLTNLRFADGNGLATATGLILSGYSLAGFFAPAVIGVVAEHHGWRLALGVLTAVFVVVALPLTFYCLREPDDRYRKVTLVGLWRSIMGRDGVESSEGNIVAGNGLARKGVSADNGVDSLERALKGRVVEGQEGKAGTKRESEKVTLEHAEEPLIQPGYAAVMVAVSAFSFAMHIIFDHLLVFLKEDFGMAFDTATLYISALNLVALFAKLIVGPLAERYNKSLLMVGFAVLGMFSSLLLLDLSWGGIAVTASVAKVKAFVVLFSTSYATIFGLTTMFLPEFGKKKLGVRSNINLMLLFGMGSVGSYAAGLLRSAVDSYKWAFVWNAASYAVVVLAGLYKYFEFDRKSSSLVTPPSSKTDTKAA